MFVYIFLFSAVQCLDTRSMSFVQILADPGVSNRYLDKRLVFSTSNAGGHQALRGQKESLNCARKCTGTRTCHGFGIVANTSGNAPCILFEFSNLSEQILKAVLGQNQSANTCEPDWWYYHDRCYTIPAWKGTWADADQYCQTVGGLLASITSDRENDFISALTMISQQNETVWIGGHHNGGTRTWTSAEPWAFEKFYPGEPNTDGTCITLYANTREWFDISCDERETFVCEKRVP